MKSTGRELSFEWSHHRISSIDSKVRVALQNSIKHSGSERLNTTAFFSHAIPPFTITECQHLIKMIAENKLHAVHRDSLLLLLLK